MHCSPPGSFVRGISQARILEWVAISFCRESSQPRDWTHICIIGRFFTTEPPGEARGSLDADLTVKLKSLKNFERVHSRILLQNWSREQFLFSFTFWPCHAARGILILRPRTGPTPLEVVELTTGLQGKSPREGFLQQDSRSTEHTQMFMCLLR